MKVTLVSPADLEPLADDLRSHSEALRATTSTGYDWVFPAISAKVTGRLLEAAATPEHFLRPDAIRGLVAQFNEIYVVNGNAWRGGGTPEPSWQRVARLSRLLGTLDLADANERSGAAVLTGLAAIYAHICVDLPRALLVIHRRLRPPLDREDLEVDYARVDPVFYPVIREMIEEAEITPRLLAKVWPHLPAWMRELVVGEDLPSGVGVVLRAMRRFAWLRSRWLARRPSQRRQADALALSDALTPFDLPEGHGLAAPDAGAAAAEAADLEAAFERFLRRGGLPRR